VSTDISETLPPVLVDEVHFDAILTNLLENAFAYAPRDATIVVRAVERDAGCVRLTVEDSGSGVAPEALEHLFEKFYRATTNGRTARRGSGIGLAVVKGLAEASGGRVSARRSELGGLAIDIDLPAVAPSFADAARTTPPA
jgi:two-component system sensor histidine kinase BaeS